MRDLDVWRNRPYDMDDPQQAPVMARCWCCGTEIYSSRDLELYDGLCEECYLASEDDEEADDEV